jgi:hypothetical protein
MQTSNIFPLQINTQNNILFLKQFNEFRKKNNLEFGCCYVCNEKKYKHEFQTCKTINLNKNIKNMKTLLKFNPKHLWENKFGIIPKELLNNTKHMHSDYKDYYLQGKVFHQLKFLYVNLVVIVYSIIKCQNLHWPMDYGLELHVIIVEPY